VCQRPKAPFQDVHQGLYQTKKPIHGKSKVGVYKLIAVHDFKRTFNAVDFNKDGKHGQYQTKQANPNQNGEEANKIPFPQLDVQQNKDGKDGIIKVAYEHSRG
jgi:hypothetical protein